MQPTMLTPVAMDTLLQNAVQVFQSQLLSVPVTPTHSAHHSQLMPCLGHMLDFSCIHMEGMYEGKVRIPHVTCFYLLLAH